MTMQLRTLYRHWRACIRQILPEFEEDLSIEFPEPGVMLFRWKLCDSFTAYLLLVLLEPDRMKIFAYWTLNAKLSDVIEGLVTDMNPRTVPEQGIACDEPENGAFAFEVAQLWSPDCEEQVWRVRREEDVHRIEEALTKTREYLIPYLHEARDEYAQQRG